MENRVFEKLLLFLISMQNTEKVYLEEVIEHYLKNIIDV